MKLRDTGLSLRNALAAKILEHLTPGGLCKLEFTWPMQQGIVGRPSSVAALAQRPRLVVSFLSAIQSKLASVFGFIIAV